MSFKLKKVVVFLKIFTCLLLSRPFRVEYGLRIIFLVSRKLETSTKRASRPARVSTVARDFMPSHSSPRASRAYRLGSGTDRIVYHRQRKFRVEDCFSVYNKAKEHENYTPFSGRG